MRAEWKWLVDGMNVAAFTDVELAELIACYSEALADRLRDQVA